MSLQSERLLNHMLRLRLSHLPNCYEAIAEEASVLAVIRKRSFFLICRQGLCDLA
jgi:hypothetical protein